MAGRPLLASLVLLRDAILAAVFVAVVWPLWVLPWRPAAALGRWCGYIVDLVWIPGRRVGMINLRRAYGLASPGVTPAAAHGP